MSIMDVENYFDFDSISSSSSPRTPIDMFSNSAYHPSSEDLSQQSMQHQQLQQSQQNHLQTPYDSKQSLYASPPSQQLQPQQDFFGSTGSFPSTPDYSVQSFGASPQSHQWASPQPSAASIEPQSTLDGALNSWSYAGNSPQVQQGSNTPQDSPSPATFDTSSQPQTFHPSAFEDHSQSQRQAEAPQYFRRTSNASYDNSQGFNAPVQSFQAHPQQFYDPSTSQQRPAYFTDMRLSSSHSTSSTASSVSDWGVGGRDIAPVPFESPFGHHHPDDVALNGQYASEPIVLPGDPLTLQEYGQHSHIQQQYGQNGPYGMSHFNASQEAFNVNGTPSPHLVPAQRGGSTGPSYNPYGALGAEASHSNASLHSVHSVHSVHSLHHNPSFPNIGVLAGVLPPPSQLGGQNPNQTPPMQHQQYQQPSPAPSNSSLASSSVPGQGDAASLLGGLVPGSGISGALGMGVPGHIAVMHTDDANSKETQFLRRRCFNCRTTDPPSWRRSTLNSGKIVCNKCGLYERTHMRPRPPRFDEMRTGSTGSTNGGASSSGGMNGGLASSSAAGAAGTNKARKNPKVLGSSPGMSSASPKGGVSKVKKDRGLSNASDRPPMGVGAGGLAGSRAASAAAGDNSRRGSFSSNASGTSDWDDGLLGASTAAGVIPNYNYGLYGHGLQYPASAPPNPNAGQSLDGNPSLLGGPIRLPRAPAMPLGAPNYGVNIARSGSVSVASSRPGTSAGDNGGSGSALHDTPSPPPNTAGTDPTPTTATHPHPLANNPYAPPKKNSTYPFPSLAFDSTTSPTSNTPPPPIAELMNGGSPNPHGSPNVDASRKASVSSSVNGSAE